MSVLPATEAHDPALADLDTREPAAILHALWQGQLAAVQAVGAALPALAAAAEAAIPRLREGGRLVYAGAGTAGRLGVQDGAELNPTFNWPAEKLLLLLAGGADAFVNAVENAEDNRQAARDAIAAHAIGPQDVAIGIAASGGTPFTLAAIEAARGCGALTIGIANSPGAALLTAAEHAILLETAPEPIAGSTRLKAGTAQKVALNLLSTLIMIRLGHVYQGRMVDMQARNDKLRQRAARMVRELDGCSPAEAETALTAAQGQVKLALVIRRGLDPAAAQALLARHRGNLRAALAEIP